MSWAARWLCLEVTQQGWLCQALTFSHHTLLCHLTLGHKVYQKVILNLVFPMEYLLNALNYLHGMFKLGNTKPLVAQ